MASNANTDIDKLITFGQMALEQGWYDQAREYFEQALALDASNREAMKGLARANEMLSRKAAVPAEPIQAEPVKPPRKEVDAMLICDKCGAQIPGGSKYCPQCADPVTEADRVGGAIQAIHSQSVAVGRAEQILLVCPKCASEDFCEVVPPRSAYNLVCPKCHTGFISRIVKVRAKRSRGSKQNYRREFSIRVIDFSGAEDLIEFVNASYQDFEIRARDMGAFSYVGDELRIVQNLTLGRYMKVMKVSKPSCFLATYLYGPASEEVVILRHLRDDVLLDSAFLSTVVSLYYRISPAIIKLLGDNRAFRIISLAVTTPIVKLANRYLHAYCEQWAHHCKQSVSIVAELPSHPCRCLLEGPKKDEQYHRLDCGQRPGCRSHLHWPAIGWS